LILCQFKIDDSNPCKLLFIGVISMLLLHFGHKINSLFVIKIHIDLREYATLTLRNVMENNAENQKLIEELRPEEVLQTEELTQMGITPELTEDGKVRIKRAI
jgi:hypothetical protein